jgi:hypothetical protein
MKLNKSLFLMTGLVFVFISFYYVSAQTQNVLNIGGYVFYNNSSGADNGIPIIINNTNTNQTFTTQVSAPPIPSQKGAYSTSIFGNINDFLIVRAYNNTHFGETNHTVTSSISQINITLNNLRTPEINVSIQSPSSNSSYFKFDSFNVSVNIAALIDDALSCEAQIIVSNTSVLNITSSNTEFIGTISPGFPQTIIFELEAIDSGSSNISVNASCSNIGIIFEGKTKDDITNITVLDSEPPVVNLINPANNFEEKTSNLVTFEYNVSGASSISECRFYLNGTLNQTNSTVTPNIVQNFSVNLSNDFYNWRIECEDDFAQINSSEIRNLTVAVHFPTITSITITDPIILNAGSTKLVWCNVSVEDLNGFSDIAGVNTTLYTTGATLGTDNFNNHYTNSSCLQSSFSGNTANYECSFRLQYYANNGSWTCNATSIDNQNLSDNQINTTLVDTLFALNVSTNFLDFEDVESGSVSNELTINIINIGNQNLSTQVRGFGGDNESEGSGFSMLCDSSNHFPLENKRYSSNPLTAFNLKTQINSSNEGMGFSILKQTTPSLQTQNTYWQVLAPPGPLGECTGTIVLSASG